jgi:hypothetical protein
VHFQLHSFLTGNSPAQASNSISLTQFCKRNGSHFQLRFVALGIPSNSIPWVPYVWDFQLRSSQSSFPTQQPDETEEEASNSVPFHNVTPAQASSSIPSGCQADSSNSISQLARVASNFHS